MLWWTGIESLKDHAIWIYHAIRIPDMDIVLQETLSAAFQTTGGVAFTVYTFKNCTSLIWVIISSGVAVGWIYIVLIRIRESYRKATDFEKKKIWAAWNLANGTVMYMANIFGLSKALKLNDKLWILCFVLAALGYSFVVSSLNFLERDFSERAYLKCCQKMFEPTLIGCATVYLLYFQSHQEEWLHWFPFAILAATGIKIAYFGSLRGENTVNAKSFMIKWIEIAMGSCLLIGSSIVLSIYLFVKNLPFLSFSMIFLIIGSLHVIYSLFESLQRYLLLDIINFYAIIGMSSVPVLLFPVSVFISVGDPYQVLHWFLTFAGTGLYIFLKSMHNRYLFYPRQEFYRTCQKVLGPVMTVYSSLATVYVGYRMGWRFTLPAVYFIPVGIYTTYRGFRRVN